VPGQQEGQDLAAQLLVIHGMPGVLTRGEQPS
jgi:hypothetical protein